MKYMITLYAGFSLILLFTALVVAYVLYTAMKE